LKELVRRKSVIARLSLPGHELIRFGAETLGESLSEFVRNAAKEKAARAKAEGEK